MNKTQSSYLSYLLRLRRVDNAGQPVWRISLEAPGSADQIYFDNLEALCAYLSKQMQSPDEKGGFKDETKRETKT